MSHANYSSLRALWNIEDQINDPDRVLACTIYGLATQIEYGKNFLFSYGWKHLAWCSLSRQINSGTANSPLNVLFIPNSDVFYVLGPCVFMAAAVSQSNRTSAVLLPSNASHDTARNIAQMYGYAGAFIAWPNPFNALMLPSLLYARKLLNSIVATLEDAQVRNFILSNKMNLIRVFLSTHLMIITCRNALRRWGVEKLVTLNEQHFPSNVFVAAANLLGIETHQILHGGMVAPEYVPFRSRYLWVETAYSEDHVRALGVPPERIISCYGLQTAAQLVASRADTKKADEQVSKAHSMLFLAQYHGYSGFGLSWAKTSLELLAQVLQQSRYLWKLDIRPHPYDSPDDIAAMRNIFGKSSQDVSFTDVTIPLSIESSKYSMVITASSTGIFTAIAAGTPACVIWGDDLDLQYVGSPLPSEWTAHSATDLMAVLDRVASVPTGCHHGFAAEQAAAIGLSATESAAESFVRTLFGERAESYQSCAGNS
jgi:hypothetical protein